MEIELELFVDSHHLGGKNLSSGKSVRNNNWKYIRLQFIHKIQCIRYDICIPNLAGANPLTVLGVSNVHINFISNIIAWVNITKNCNDVSGSIPEVLIRDIEGIPFVFEYITSSKDITSLLIIPQLSSEVLSNSENAFPLRSRRIRANDISRFIHS